jgi:hypothetical protein
MQQHDVGRGKNWKTNLGSNGHIPLSGMYVIRIAVGYITKVTEAPRQASYSIFIGSLRD